VQGPPRTAVPALLTTTGARRISAGWPESAPAAYSALRRARRRTWPRNQDPPLAATSWNKTNRLANLGAGCEAAEHIVHVVVGDRAADQACRTVRPRPDWWRMSAHRARASPTSGW
jgi:hypothetical protein